MARALDRSQEIKYVYDVPYTERKLLCNILDLNNDWERLGGTYMGFKYYELEEFRRAERCGESPTNRLLQVWGQQNHTLTELIWYLWQMEHLQALRAIKACIPAKYLKLLDDERHMPTIFPDKPTRGMAVKPPEAPGGPNSTYVHPNTHTRPDINYARPDVTHSREVVHSQESAHSLPHASYYSHTNPPFHPAALQDTSTPRINPVNPGPRENAMFLEGAVAMDPSHYPPAPHQYPPMHHHPPSSPQHSNHHHHNINQDLPPHPPSYPTSPKVPESFLYPSHSSINHQPQGVVAGMQGVQQEKNSMHGVGQGITGGPNSMLGVGQGIAGGPNSLQGVQQDIAGGQNSFHRVRQGVPGGGHSNHIAEGERIGQGSTGGERSRQDVHRRDPIMQKTAEGRRVNQDMEREVMMQSKTGGGNMTNNVTGEVRHSANNGNQPTSPPPHTTATPDRKINNDEGFGIEVPVCGVSCEDNTRVERTPYDPDQDYIDRCREKAAKEAARQAEEAGVTHSICHNPASHALNQGAATPARQHPQPPPSRKISTASCSSSVDGGPGSCSSSVPVIPYKELEEATALWSQHHLLGSGGFGAVFKGTWKNTEVAVKRIEPHGNASHDDTHLHISQSLEELKLLQSYRHDNILQVYGYSTDNEQYPCLVYQFMPNGSVEDKLQGRKIEAFDLSGVSGGSSCSGGGGGQRPGLTWRQRYRVAWGTARALQFLHTVKDKPLIHGDVKSANVLLDQNYEPKLGDFGLAREGKSQSTSIKVSRVHGTKPYLPDDYLRNKKLSVKVDTYSYGIVLFELCTGLRAYDETRKDGLKFLKDLIDDTKESESLRDRSVGGYDEEVFTFLYKLGKDCIRRVAKKRPDMKSVFEDLEKFGLLLEENARARKISLGENSSVCSSPHLLQVCYDTASHPYTSTQPPSSFPQHHFHLVSSPSTASTLPPSPSPVPISPAHSPAPPSAHSPRPPLHYAPQLSPRPPLHYAPSPQYYAHPTHHVLQRQIGTVPPQHHHHPSRFLPPHVNITPDPPSYSETMGPGGGMIGGAGAFGGYGAGARVVDGAMGGFTGYTRMAGGAEMTGYGAPPAVLPQFSRLQVDGSSSTDSYLESSGSSQRNSTTQNLETWQETKRNNTPVAAPVPMMPNLTELGVKSSTDANLPKLSALDNQPSSPSSSSSSSSLSD